MNLEQLHEQKTCHFCGTEIEPQDEVQVFEGHIYHDDCHDEMRECQRIHAMESRDDEIERALEHEAMNRQGPDYWRDPESGEWRLG